MPRLPRRRLRQRSQSSLRWATPIQYRRASNRVLARPGANLTGISILGGELGAKRLDLLRYLVPAASTIAILVNPQNKLRSPNYSK